MQTVVITMSVICLLVVSYPQAQSARVTQNAAGDYVIRFDVNDEPQEFVFERATHILPEVRAHVVRSEDGHGYEYRYHVTNGLGARQQLHSFTVTNAYDVTLLPSPAGWKGDTVPRRGRTYWVRLTPEGMRGIPPGHHVEGFAFKSAMLPGPTDAELRGAKEPTTVTAVVPESALSELRRLLERDYVTAVTIGPSIPGFSKLEPELTVAVFLSRVKMRFTAPVVRSGHPHAQEILGAFDEAIAAATKHSRADTQIASIEQIARRPSTLPLVTELNHALLINLEHARTSAK